MAGRLRIGRCRVSVEPNGSFAVDRTGTIGNFADIRAMSTVSSQAVAHLTDDSLRSRVWQKNQEQIGFRACAFEWSAYLTGCGQTLDASTSPTQDTMSKVIGAIAGGYTAAQGSLVASGASTTGFTVTGTQGSRFPAGSIVWIETAVASGLYVPRKVKTQATDALTFSIATSFTPAVGARVLNSQLLYPGTIAPGSETSLQWLLEGEDRDASVMALLMGCQGDLKLDLSLGALAKVSSSQKGATWLQDSAIATPQGGGALGLATYDGSVPVMVSGPAIFTPAGGTTLTTPTITKIEASLGVAWQMVPTYNGVQGEGTQELMPTDVTVTIDLLAQDRTYHTARDNQTPYQLLLQCGNTAGKQVAVEFPNLQIVDVQTVDQNGLHYDRLTCVALQDSNAVDLSTDLRAAPWRIAR